LSSPDSRNRKIKIGTTIDMCGPDEAVEIAVVAEKAGYDSLWLPDHLIDTVWPKLEPWSIIGAISMATNKVVMCTAVTDTQRAHPARTAHAVATLSEMSSGRVWLGIGAGEAMNLIPFGIPFEKPPKRAQRLEEAIEVIRLLWSSSRKSRVNFAGTYYNLRNAWLDLDMTHAPPIYVGALGGRRALEITGKHGDGWLSYINTPETFRKRFGIARDAASRAGRDPDKLGAALWTFVSMARSEEDLRKAMSYTKISLLMEMHTLELMGFKIPEDAHTIPYQSMLVSDEAESRVTEMERTVPDEIAQQFLVYGSPSEMVERMERFKEAGASHFVVEFTERGKGPIQDFASKVLPSLAR
jgi:phthiodiolone/phenolphthiodiolone dimycocerosates ketoreductase